MSPGRIVLALALVAAASSPAAAQAPKAGDWYEDSIDLGFKVKGPKGWEFIPPRPGETNLIGQYDAGRARQILAADRTGGTVWNYYAWLLKFDRREKPGDDGKRRSKGPADFAEWMKKNGPGTRGGDWREDEDARKTGKVGKVPVREYEFWSTMGEDTEIRVYAMVYQLDPEYEVAYVFNGPGGKKWSKHQSACRRLAKTLKPVEVERLETEAGEGTLRDRKRQQLEAEVAKAAGWELYETPNYFIVSNNPDEDFIDELMERVEAIREVYTELYPPELAERLRALAEAEGEGADDEPSGRTVVAEDDPMEVARTSVIRVCKTREQYNSYGGPPNTGGYWSSSHKELVVFDDKQVLGRASTWGTLNHEAFHQYIYYFFGNLAPHSWYNEGHGDFFGGYEYKHKKFHLTRYEKRIRTIQAVLRDDRHVPLKDLVRFSQGEYYGSNSLGASIGDNYAQGWSLVYFLRTGAKDARCWNPEWEPILDTYLEVLVKTGDLEEAVDAAFAGVDWEELEACWKAYTLE